MNTCIFCGPTTEKLTGEHIYSDWISRKLRKYGFNLYETSVVTNRTRWTKKTGSIDLTVPVVCGTCNNDWLGKIEKKFLAPFFFELIRGKPRLRLTIENQATLAFWLTRLAMVYEFRDKHPTDPTFFTQAEREHFRNQEPFPTKHTRIWITQYIGKQLVFVGARNVHPGGQGDPSDYSDSIHVTNGVIGRFAFQIWSRRWPSLDPTDAAVDRALRPFLDPWRNHTVPLWPSANDNLLWRPSNDLVDSSLKPFFDRFGGETTF